MIENNLISLMNNSRWNNVYLNFQDQNLPFLYRSKTVDGEYFPESNNDLRFDCREVFPKSFKDIEWIEIYSKEENNKLAKKIAIKSKARFIETSYGIKIVGYIHNSEIDKVQK